MSTVLFGTFWPIGKYIIIQEGLYGHDYHDENEDDNGNDNDDDACCLMCTHELLALRLLSCCSAVKSAISAKRFCTE